jgi:membrane protein YqaA with SNARE-associated domain
LLVSSLWLIVQPSATRKLLRWLYHLGGLGLIPLGMLDNSVIPVAGSMDVITVLLCAHGSDWWPYYVLMATLGSLLGGYTTYCLAQGEGKGRFSKMLSRSKMKGFKPLFEKWGFGAIIVPAILPPPFPMVPFLIAAGATQYPRTKFISALAIGRGVRYTILGLLGFLYGHWILNVMRQHVHAIIYVGAALIFASATLAYFRLRHDSAYTRGARPSRAASHS